ncbi:hypothetical protein MKD33_19315, partial [Chromobacterium piscinae]
PPKPEPKPE